MVWQTYYADLDLHLMHSEIEGECYYANPHTTWGCIYNYDNLGGKGYGDPFPYAEQITVDLDHLFQNPSCTYSFWVHFYGNGSSPKNVPATLDLFWDEELIESLSTTLSGPGDWQKVWEGCIGELKLLVIIYNETEAQNNSCPDTEGQAGDPINLYSGAQTLEQDLLTVQGALPISFGLQYNFLLLRTTYQWRHQSQLVYDEHHNLLSATNALGKSIQLVYDDHHRLIQLTDPQSQVTRYTYDNQGQVLTKTTPRGGITTLGYSNGHLTQLTDPEGISYTLGYPVWMR